MRLRYLALHTKRKNNKVCDYATCKACADTSIQVEKFDEAFEIWQQV